MATFIYYFPEIVFTEKVYFIETTSFNYFLPRLDQYNEIHPAASLWAVIIISLLHLLLSLIDISLNATLISTATGLLADKL